MTSNDTLVDEDYEKVNGQQEAPIEDQIENVEEAGEQGPAESAPEGEGFPKRKPKKARKAKTPPEDSEEAGEQKPSESTPRGNGFFKRKPKKVDNTQTPPEDVEERQDQESTESAPEKQGFFKRRLKFFKSKPKKVRKAKTPGQSILTVSQFTAGAGIIGLVGFFSLFLISMLFFITENYFLSMFIISLALLVYSTGTDFVKLILSSFTIFFSSKHLLTKAVYLSDTLHAVSSNLLITRTIHGELKVAPLRKHQAITLPDNSLTRDMKDLMENDEGLDYADAIAHSYFVDCHELYSYSHSNLEFVANVMPLFGLIGTILGLIAMFDGLGADVTVETLTPQLALALKTTLYGAIFSSLYKIIGSRFEQRQKFLEYDFDAFTRFLEVLFTHKNTIEVAK